MGDLTQFIMLDDSVTDFRSVIEEKLKLKKTALDETEQHLKKFSVLRGNNGSIPTGKFPNDSAISRQNSERNSGPNRGSVRGRLGPPPNSRLSLESRLGPKVQERQENEPNDDHFQEGTKSVLSRVVVEQQKSRDEALAEEGQKMDKKEKQRNRRMFGNLLGTLQKFKQDETRVTDRSQKKREVEKKIEEKTEKEKEEAKRTKYELFSEKKKQQQEIKMLQIQMERVQQYELWEKNKRREMQYIKTSAAPEGQPQIFYLPKEHNDKTMAKFEATITSIEEEIKVAKASLEEDLLKIERKMSQNPESLMRDEDLIHEDDFDDNDETENKPRSVITVAQPLKRPRQDSHRREQEKTEPDKSMRITIKNETKPTETKSSVAPPPSLPPPATVPPLAKKIKVEKGLSGSQEKKPSSEKSRKRKDSSSGSADSSDSSSDSDSSSGSEDENSPKKKLVKRIKTEKK